MSKLPEDNKIQEENNIENKVLKDEIKLLGKTEMAKSPHRFNIMILLYTFKELGFTTLYKKLQLTPGNLEHHLKAMSEMGWITAYFRYNMRFLKIIQITQAGEAAIQEYIDNLKNIIHELG